MNAWLARWQGTRKPGMLAAWTLAVLLCRSGPLWAAEPVVFVDFSWDSAQVHNRIAAFILEHGYGYQVDYLFADTVPGMLAVDRGDAHIAMEIWPDNTPEVWAGMLRRGRVLNMGTNFPDAPQGWYVPTYLIEGDPERGIEPLAPDLRSVADLPRYWELFRDPEDPRRGRFYNAAAGWVAHDINLKKMEAYGLEDTFVFFNPGSEAALVASLTAAYERGLPWVGYSWEPTWVMGLYNMTRLEEPEYTDACWQSHMGCAYPASEVLIAVNKAFAERHPPVRELLERYETTLRQNNEFLAYMQSRSASAEEAARFFLRQHEETWTRWVSAEVAEKVKAAL